MIQAGAFKEWFLRRGYKLSTYNTHASYVRQIDQAIGGLDEKIKSDGIDAVLAWAKAATVGPFETYPAQSRSVLNRYIEFVIDAQSPPDEVEQDLIEEETNPVVFHLEREMQAAVRKQLHLLEAGLKEADGGAEISVATGKIDIVAEDKNGELVVIELKAGQCPPGALEQVLGYAQALSEERSQKTRAYLIAAGFPDRMRAAAKRSTGLQLRTYEFTMKFNAAV